MTLLCPRFYWVNDQLKGWFCANAIYALSDVGEEAKDAALTLMQALQDEDVRVSATEGQQKH